MLLIGKHYKKKFNYIEVHVYERRVNGMLYNVPIFNLFLLFGYAPFRGMRIRSRPYNIHLSESSDTKYTGSLPLTVMAASSFFKVYLHLHTQTGCITSRCLVYLLLIFCWFYL